MFATSTSSSKKSQLEAESKGKINVPATVELCGRCFKGGRRTSAPLARGGSSTRDRSRLLKSLNEFYHWFNCRTESSAGTVLLHRVKRTYF